MSRPRQSRPEQSGWTTDRLHASLSGAASCRMVAEAATAMLPALLDVDGAAVFLRRDDGSLELAAHRTPSSVRQLLVRAAGRLIRLPPDADVPAGRVARGGLVEVWEAENGGRLETYPLQSTGKILGVLCLLRARRGQRAGAGFAQAAVTEVAEALDAATERERSQEVAEDLWRSRSPRSAPRLPHLDISWCSARGDRDLGAWCDVAQVGPGTVVVASGATGDVSAVAVSAAAARHALSASCALTDDPGELVGLLTDFSQAHLGLSEDAACCVARVDSATGRLDWSGTPGQRPIVVRGGSPLQLDARERGGAHLEPGDVLVMGVRQLSASNGGGDVPAVEAVGAMTDGSMAGACDILASDERWNGGQSRDQALVLVRMSPPRPMLTTIGSSASVSLSRAYTRRELSHLGVRSQSLLDDAELVTSELVSNVVRHVGGLFGVWWQRVGDVIRVEVSDRGAPLDLRIPETEVLGESGRGLLIIDALSTGWGVNNALDGKVVWAELAVTRDDRGTARR